LFRFVSFSSPRLWFFTLMPRFQARPRASIDADRSDRSTPTERRILVDGANNVAMMYDFSEDPDGDGDV